MTISNYKHLKIDFRSTSNAPEFVELVKQVIIIKHNLMKTLKTMDIEVNMIVILCSKIMLLSAHARAWELLIKFEATRTGPPAYCCYID